MEMIMLRVLLTIMAALLMLSTAISFAKAAAAAPCLTLAQVKAKHPGQHPRYRDVDGTRYWYVGRRAPAKSEFAHCKQVAKAKPPAPGRAAVAVAQQAAAPEPPAIVWPDPADVMWEWAPVDTDILIELVCGGLCQIPPLSFEQRWRIGS
jgi:hypothetical protein